MFVSAVKKTLLCFITIGGFLTINQSLASDLEKSQIQKEEQEYPHFDYVEVEPLYIEPTKVKGQYRLFPYKERREKWSRTYALIWSDYDPINYDSEYSNENYEDLVDVGSTALYELEMTFQKNYSWMSLAVEFGAGFYNSKARSTFADGITLELIPVRGGLRFNLDQLWDEPYIVPYISGGFYTIFFDEKLNSRRFNGNTSLAPYWSAGAKFQLNWLERSAARVAYEENGLQNTYIFLEVRQYLESSTEADPNFQNEPSLSAGLSIEL